MEAKKICVIGLGYIGLPTASLLATRGYQVHGVDVNPEVVETISAGNIHIYEPDLDVMVRSAVGSGNLKVSTQPIESDIFIIAVPTPFQSEYQPDLSFVEKACRSIAKVLKPKNLVILESTSPVGTTKKMKEWIGSECPDLRNVSFAYCPERVLPGKILKELVENARIVGGLDKEATSQAVAFYRTFITGDILETDSDTAEMSKLTENAFRDVNIAFANELSIVCNHLGVDPWKVIELANHHPRVNILRPGPGVGGHCIAVDPWFIVASRPEETHLIRAARRVNDSKPDFVVQKVREYLKAKPEAKLVCLGLSFKPDIDDLRESPAVEIVERLHKVLGQKISVCEPHIQELPTKLEGKAVLVELTPEINQFDLILHLVDHKQFLSFDFESRKIIDTRGRFKNAQLSL